MFNCPVMDEMWKQVGCNAHPWSRVNSWPHPDGRIFQCLACAHESACGECLHAAMLEVQSVHNQIQMAAKVGPVVAPSKDKVKRKVRRRNDAHK